MQHRGEIVEKAVRQSGYPLTKLVSRLGKSRRWIYNAFENAQLPLDHILRIGKIIHHDFSEEIDELKGGFPANRRILHYTLCPRNTGFRILAFEVLFIARKV